MWFRKFLQFTLILFAGKSYAQQDVTFHLNTSFLQGKSVIKVKRDFYDPYVWVLAKNNEVYRINSQTLVIDNSVRGYCRHKPGYGFYRYEFNQCNPV